MGRRKLLIKTVIIDEGISRIGNYTFFELRNMTNISIASTVTSIASIGSDAFGRCSSLSSIEIPLGVTVIPDACFQDCLLSSITPNITSIGYNAFLGCNLKSITIPSTVESIAFCAFYGCRSLESVAFASPSRLKTLEHGFLPIVSSVESIPYEAFLRCNS